MLYLFLCPCYWTSEGQSPWALCLRNLHTKPQVLLPYPLVFTEADVRSQFQFLPFHSTPGPKVPRTTIFSAFSHEPGGMRNDRSAIFELTMFVNAAVDGFLLISCQFLFCCIILLGLMKSNESLRTVEIDPTLCRSISELFMRRLSRYFELSKYFLPPQLVFGVPHGTEYTLHASRFL